MVHTCVVWGCSNRAGVGENARKFFDIPKVIHHQGKQTEELSAERRTLWLSRINRANFNPDPRKRHFKDDYYTDVHLLPTDCENQII